jgi:hypothetical protein
MPLCVYFPLRRRQEVVGWSAHAGAAGRKTSRDTYNLYAGVVTIPLSLVFVAKLKTNLLLWL